MNAADTAFTHVRYDADIAFRSRVRTLVEFLSPGDGETLLDAGCGLGFYLSVLSALTRCTLIGLEFDETRIRHAALAAPAATLVRGDITSLPFHQAAFDKVLASEVLEHLPDDAAALAELFRVLRPGGVAAFSVPYRNYPFLWDPLNKSREALRFGHFEREPWSGIWTDHRRLYRRSDLVRKVEAAGFQVTDVRLQTRWSMPFAHLLVYGLGKAVVSRRGGDAERRRDSFWGRPPNSKALRLALRTFTAIDRLNRAEYRSGPAVSLCLRAVRPLN